MTHRWQRRRRGRRALTVAALTLTGLIGLAPAAAAHVAVDSAKPNGDGTTAVTLTWNHSCTPGTATTGVDVTAGPGVSFTGASTGIPGWTFTVDPGTVTFTGPTSLPGSRSRSRSTPASPAHPAPRSPSRPSSTAASSRPPGPTPTHPPTTQPPA